MHGYSIQYHTYGCIMYTLIAIVICVELIIIVIVTLCVKRRMVKRKRDVECGGNDDEEGPSPAKKQRCHESTVEFANQPRGLPNTGASCYMNSMLQCLSWTPCLRLQLEKQTRKQVTTRREGGLAKALLTLLKKNHENRQEKYCFVKRCFSKILSKQKERVKQFLKELSKVNKKFNGSNQQDSFEFYNILLSGLEEEVLEYIPYDSNSSTRTLEEHIMQSCDSLAIFGGKFVTYFCYEECGHVDLAFQRFTSISVPVVKDIDTATEKYTNRFQKTHHMKTGLYQEDDPSTIKYINESQRQGTAKLKDEGKRRSTTMLTDSETRIKSIGEGNQNVNIPISSCQPVQMTFVEEQNSNGLSTDDDVSGRSLSSISVNRRMTDIEEGLSMLTNTETMDASVLPCRICERNRKGGHTGDLQKRLQMVTMPHVLVLHLNRFEQHGFKMSKVERNLSYPKLLDMSKFCSSAMEVVSEEYKVMYPRLYSLYGVVNHHGTMEGGHYYAYIKTSGRYVDRIHQELDNYAWRDPENIAENIRKHIEDIWKNKSRRIHKHKDAYEKEVPDQWFYVSDTHVQKEEEENVMNSSSAYILMYERV